MVKLLNLDDDGDPASFAPPYAAFGDLKIRNRSSGEVPQDTRGIFRATTYYPVVSEIATQLDLTSLDQLSQTCRQIRSNLLQHRTSLISRTLRCQNDGRARIPCARDLNCIQKPMSNALAGRHRRLCKTCLKAPLERHMISIENSGDGERTPDGERSQTTFYHGPCTCVNQMWFCEDCARHQRSEDTKYLRGWNWRRRYSHTGVGIGEGEQGVACGRESRCLAVREVEVEIDADQFQMPFEVLGTDNLRWGTTSYQTQEVEGIGGVVKKKVKKRVNIGHVVKEYEDEREGGEYLHRERINQIRSCLLSSKLHTGQGSGDTTPTGVEKTQAIEGKPSIKKKLLDLVKKDSNKSPPESVGGEKETSEDHAASNRSNMAETKHLPGLMGKAGGASDVPRPRSASPNHASAASSLIFERNVQESTMPSNVPSAIPAHMKTEDQIPPALEASSLAITDDHLGPEEVEVVTHTAHQPAAAIIAESIPSAHQSEVNVALSPQESQQESVMHSPRYDADDNMSTYGSLDPNDVRRLSFISFADVVHGEHAETGSQHSLHHVPLSATTDPGVSQSPNANRPISPTRSPLSTFSHPFSQEVTTPPTTASGPGSAKGVELSPPRSLNASPTISSPPPQQQQHHGELSIETLGQALRKTASRDLSGFNRSPPTSAI
ncbi:hypothetical protein CAC42_4068 [Sphaceloma murrayae]|uniref:Uncharacterized protein n=1 Tax=Sphaceloma murrayae TaxID=2082308 RepID=A0A2K1QSZ5_9PEZI|nr:hypothetical protein CAC42_4068 [Sphaceloma murrayae]